MENNIYKKLNVVNPNTLYKYTDDNGDTYYELAYIKNFGTLKEKTHFRIFDTLKDANAFRKKLKSNHNYNG